MNQGEYRPNLPPIPKRMLGRPIVKGWPLPWFVAPAELTGGAYDFRVADPRKFVIAITDQRCWICGGRMGAFKAFTIGPMCAVNRTTAEPPAHSECAHWAAIACPFLNQQQYKRRESGLPEAYVAPPGEMLTRQPGATLVWTTKQFSLFGDGRGGALIHIGDPVETAWYTSGRTATRAEVLASIESGLPILRERAAEGGEAVLKELEGQISRAMQYVPA